MRPGPISQEELQAALGATYPVHTYTHSLVKEVRTLFAGLRSPGLLHQHYCTHTRLELFHSDQNPQALVAQLADLPGPLALVCLGRPNLASVPGHIHLYWLSQMGILIEAARHLFDLLHRLDTQGYRSLYVQLAPEVGIGVAVNNRLRRAAAKFSKP
jgi:L-threonylcarbamoyladenylate synthase